MRNECQPEPEPEPVKKEEPNGSSKKAPQIRRKSSLPADWKLPHDWGQWAIQEGIDEVTVRREADQFKDYHIGHGNTMLDWRRAWQTWVRNHFKFNAPRSKAADQAQRESYAQQVLREYGGPPR